MSLFSLYALPGNDLGPVYKNTLKPQLSHPSPEQFLSSLSVNLYELLTHFYLRVEFLKSFSEILFHYLAHFFLQQTSPMCRSNTIGGELNQLETTYTILVWNIDNVYWCKYFLLELFSHAFKY